MATKNISKEPDMATKVKPRNGNTLEKEKKNRRKTNVKDKKNE